jgi:hypothetical protein
MDRLEESDRVDQRFETTINDLKAGHDPSFHSPGAIAAIVALTCSVRQSRKSNRSQFAATDPDGPARMSANPI